MRRGLFSLGILTLFLLNPIVLHAQVGIELEEDYKFGDNEITMDFHPAFVYSMEDEIYITDANNQSILVIDPINFNIIKTITPNFLPETPQNLSATVVSKNNIFYSVTSKNEIIKYDEFGNLLSSTLIHLPDLFNSSEFISIAIDKNVGSAKLISNVLVHDDVNAGFFYETRQYTPDLLDYQVLNKISANSANIQFSYINGKPNHIFADYVNFNSSSKVITGVVYSYSVSDEKYITKSVNISSLNKNFDVFGTIRNARNVFNFSLGYIIFEETGSNVVLSHSFEFAGVIDQLQENELITNIISVDFNTKLSTFFIISLNYNLVFKIKIVDIQIVSSSTQPIDPFLFEIINDWRFQFSVIIVLILAIVLVLRRKWGDKR